jgi:hypothetical protein
MLNLIVVGNPDYHSFFSDNNGEASFPISRLFESTPGHTVPLYAQGGYLSRISFGK